MAIIVKCKRGAADKQATDISSNLISTQAVATSRGKRFLDDPNQGGYYTVTTYELKVPHKLELKPNDSIKITDAKLGLTDAILRVNSYKISGNNEGIWANISASLAE